ncbi:MAG: sensor histidine kinase [Chitinophagaceae bacterium]|nr:sensor histidine kinase [Chitinophagaceae bacterium]
MQKTPDDIVIFLLVTTSIILLMAVFVITMILFYRKKQIAYQKDLDHVKADYEKAILSSQLEVQEQTFQHISREIHDNIGISLTLAKLNLNTLNLEDTGHSREKVDSSIALVTKAINDLNDISQSLNAEYIAGYGLINSLEQETGKLRNLGLHEIIFEVSGNTVFMDAQKELVIFRIVQEALNNILKHAEAKKIAVHLSYDETALNLSICDDGKGFIIPYVHSSNGKKKGAGLINMTKRAEMINGYWVIDSGPGNGTLIKLLVPY